MPNWHEDWPAALLLLVAIVCLVAVAVWVLRRRPRVSTTGTGNPNPAYITDEMWWLWQQLQALEPSSQLGGIYANKPGYHNTRRQLPAWDYSVEDDPPDQGGPGDKAAAIDWTFPNAQAGNYSTIALYTRRLMASAQDPADPRLDGWREFYGNLNDGGSVDGYDMRYGYAATSDSSHYWHIHLSENRDQATSLDNKKALLSVLSGESLARWLGGAEGDGAVILNDPNNPGRIDLFYVGPRGEVWHRWYPGGMNQMWSSAGSAENLRGGIVPGTLSAAWLPDGSGVNIVGLGGPDPTATPPPVGCGQYWGYTLGRSGAKSGWGSMPGVYGALTITG